MTEEFDEEQNYVELSDEDGNVTKCEVLDIVEFEGKSYALLIPVGEEEYDEEEVILLEYVEENENDAYFQNIEDEDEFNRVSEYIQSLNEEEEDEE